MAKQYIPGVSGLLTEPNPVDSPSNTLSEAENVVITQRGKVQARHGLNVNESEDAIVPTKGIPDIPAPSGNNYIPQIEQVNRVLGNSFKENFLDSICYSSFAENNNFFFKFYEFKDSSDRVMSGFLVKQNRNEYTPFKPTENTYRFLLNTESTDANYLYYKINKDTGKLEKVEKAEYREVSDVFTTKESMYISTEDGIAECNLDDVYRPTQDRFFTIKWPPFPQLNYKIVKSDLYQNWLLSGHKCGIRFTFYRESGYTDSPGEIYESQPSRIYEIYNHGENGILEIDLDFNFIINDSELYQQWNEFSAANNGRKFGILVYRTKIDTILNSENKAKPLPTDYWQCYEEIPFDSLFTFTLDNSPFPDNEFLQDGGEYKFAIKPYKLNSIYRNQYLSGTLKIGDIVSYGLNEKNANNFTNTFVNKLIASKRNTTKVTYTNPDSIDKYDYESAKLEVVDKKQYANEVLYERQHLNAVNTQLYYKTSPYYEVDTSSTYSKYFGFTYKNTDSLDKFINQLTVRVGINNFYTRSEFLANTSITFTPDDYLDIKIDGQYRNVFFSNESLTPTQIATRITNDLSQYGVFSYYLNNHLYIARSTPLLTYNVSSPTATFLIQQVDDPINKFAFKVGFNLTNNRLSLLPNFPENSGIRVEIWEYDESKTNFNLNPYLRLSNQLAYGESVFTSSSSTKYPTFFENDLVIESVVTSTETYNSVKYKADALNILDKMESNTTQQFNVGTKNFIKVNFNQLIKLQSEKSYFVAISSKGFDSLQPFFGIYGNELIDINYTSNVFTWNSGETPKFNNTMGNAYFDISFNQVNPKYWYKFKAFNPIIDSNGGTRSFGLFDGIVGSTTLNTGEYLRKGLRQYKRSSSDPYLSPTYQPIPFANVFFPISTELGPKTSNVVGNAVFGASNTITVPCRVENGQYVYFSATAYYGSAYLPVELRDQRVVIAARRTSGVSRITLSTAHSGLIKGQYFEVKNLVLPGSNTSFNTGGSIQAKYFADSSSVYIEYDQPGLPDVSTTTATTNGQYLWYSTPFYQITDVIVTEPATPTSSVTSTFKLGSTTFTSDSNTFALMYILSDKQLTDGRIFVKSVNAKLFVNDDGITYSQRELYTDKNQDGESNRNMVVPKATSIIPFKDFYLHAGIKKPLEAVLSVVSLPKTEQVQLSLPNLYTYNDVDVKTTYNITDLTMTNDGISNGDLYLDSAVLKRYAKIMSLQNGFCEVAPNISTDFFNSRLGKTATNISFGSATITVNNSTGIELNMFIMQQNLGSLYFSADTKVINISGTTITLDKPALRSGTNVNVDFFISYKIFPFRATLAERPYLTLKLTSTNNDVNYISIQTEAFYNRRGFYEHELNSTYNVYDGKSLESSTNVEEMNSFIKPTSGTFTRIGLIPGMVAGEGEGQCKSDGYHLRTGSVSTSLTTSTSEVYFDETNKKLILTGLKRLDIDQFKSPGHILIQANSNYGHNILIYYTNIVPDTTVVNKYSFNNAKAVYMSYNKYILDINTTNLANFQYYEVNLWSIQSSTANNIPLYYYSVPQLPTASMNLTSTANLSLTESWDGYKVVSTSINPFENNIVEPSPMLTFKPHRNRTTVPTAIFSTTGNHLFLGSNQLPTVAFLDEYASLIVDRFNVELQSRGINASLRKGASFAEIIITYPDGQSIEMLNGKYDVTANTISLPGYHRFSPDIGKSTSTVEPLFTQLAKRVDSELYFKNELYKTRRKIPEITTVESSFVLGKKEKAIIGYAENTDDLYIFKEDGIFRIIDSGNVSNDIPFTEQVTVSTTIICQAGGSIQEINDEIIFLSQYGFMSITNGRIENIGDAIQRDIIKSLETAVKEKIRSFVNETKNLYYCTFVSATDNSVSGTYVFNTLTRQWTFINEQILDGMEDHKGRNLVAYRQRSVVADSEISPAYEGSSYYEPSTGGSSLAYSFKIDNFNFTQPLTTIDKYNNFYYISREKHTDNISTNEQDQYDFITSNYINAPFVQNYPSITNIVKTTTGFSIRSLQESIVADDRSSNNLGLSTYYKPRYNDLSVYVNSIYGENILIDSFVQFFINRTVKAKIKTDVSTELHDIRITKTEYITIPYGGSGSSWPAVSYTFDLVAPPTNWSVLAIQEVQILVGVPVKITFNPESGNAPDTNKLFQEYMVHTETANKGAAMAFKTDGRTNFSSDRKFVYDAATTNRNVFRTYIPTAMSRGRYLIRQVKHDVPLENLIITGQTIVMRDSGSTRVQKDKDNE